MFVGVLCCFNKFVDHGGGRGNMAQALTRWRHPVASSESQDVLHRAMHPASYCCIRMAIKIASDLPALFVVVDLLFAHNVSKIPCYGQHKLKPSYFVVVIDVISLFVCLWHPPLTIYVVSITLF